MYNIYIYAPTVGPWTAAATRGSSTGRETCPWPPALDRPTQPQLVPCEEGSYLRRIDFCITQL